MICFQRVFVVLSYLIPAAALTMDESTIGDERAVPRHIEHEELELMPLESVLDHGRQLFSAKFTILDGAGRPAATQAEIPVKRRPDSTPAFFRTAGPAANACNGCHNQPGDGGAGEFVANVFTSEGFSDFNFDTLEPQFSNERGTPHLNGSGFVELLAREMSQDLQNIREQTVIQARDMRSPVTSTLESKGINFGFITALPNGFLDISKVRGVDHDLIVRPFSQKGVFTSLRQFSINALNTHHGMQSDERWGLQWTHSDDFDEDGLTNEITSGDITALVMFQAMLPAPIQLLPETSLLESAARTGEMIFNKVGCTGCHTPFLPLNSPVFSEPGPYNAAGNLRNSDGAFNFRFKLSTEGLTQNQHGQWLIPVYSDLRRHRIADQTKSHLANERLSQRFVPRDVFLTARLWGVGSTAPYGHRGDITTLREVILHHGGEASDSRLQFEGLTELEQRQVIEFLKSLQIRDRFQ